MATSQLLIESLKKTIITDSASDAPVIPFFLDGDMIGGWEGWLQVSFARRATAEVLGTSEISREQSYPALGGAAAQRCDLLLKPSRGVPVWCELKTQRSAAYKSTFDDFYNDCKKSIDQSAQWKDANVYIAAAIMKLVAGDADKLKTFAGSGKPTRGQLKYFQIASLGQSGAIPTFTDVTDTINNLAVGSAVLVTFRSI